MKSELSRLPEAIQGRLTELESALAAALGADLGALVVYGSVARGEYHANESDVDVMLVLERDAEEKLEAIGPALQLARFSARIEVMILRRDEIPRASDCFPLLYDDIARTSVVLRGDNPFAGVHIHGEHKRLRIEQELREARIRLRRVVSDMSGEPSFGRALERKVKQLRAPLRALLSLHGAEPAEQLEAVLDGAAALYHLDLAPLRKARENPRGAYAALTALLEHALVDVDGFDVAKPVDGFDVAEPVDGFDVAKSADGSAPTTSVVPGASHG